MAMHAHVTGTPHKERVEMWMRVRMTGAPGHGCPEKYSADPERLGATVALGRLVL